VLLAFVVAIIAGVWRDKYRLVGFDSVFTGMSKQDVIQKLGRPRWIINKPGCQWEFVSYRNGCSEVFVYASIFSPLIPRYEVIWLNSEGQVLNKYIYESP